MTGKYTKVLNLAHGISKYTEIRRDSTIKDELDNGRFFREISLIPKQNTAAFDIIIIPSTLEAKLTIPFGGQEITAEALKTLNDLHAILTKYNKYQNRE